MLVSEAITRVRETVQDLPADRYSDARIIGALNLGILDTRRDRPDLFIGRFDVDTYQITSTTELFDVPEIAIPPLISYAIGWIEMSSDEYSNDSRAVAMLKKHSGDLIGR